MDQRTSQRGFGLVELMIALALGLILTGGVITLFTSVLKSNSDLVKTSQLENELHATLGLMVRDIRRAGYDAKASPMPGYDNPFGLVHPISDSGEAGGSCLLLSYDMDNDGELDDRDQVGYRWYKNEGVVQIAKQIVDGATDCKGVSEWEDVTTRNLINVENLDFVVTTTDVDGMKIRRVDVTLEGQLRHDSNVKRSYTRTVRVRNNARGAS